MREPLGVSLLGVLRSLAFCRLGNFLDLFLVVFSVFLVVVLLGKVTFFHFLKVTYSLIIKGLLTGRFILIFGRVFGLQGSNRPVQILP